MKWKDLRNKRWFRVITNRYILILLLFAIWMIFFDANSWIIQKELDTEIDGLEKNAEFYRKEIKRDREFMEKLSDSDEMERFGREEYYLKKDNEDIFIIEHEDSIRKKN